MAFHSDVSEARVSKFQSSSLSSASPFNSSVYFDNISHWEKEAQRMLRTSTSLDHIRLICSFFPFQNSNTREELLSGRDEIILDKLWKSLPPKKYKPTVKNACSAVDIKLRKARELLQRIDPDLPALPIWNEKWSPPSSSSTMTAVQIADIIDVEISSRLKIIPFTEYMKGSSPIVQNLLDGILNTRRELCRHFEELHQPKDVYEQVTKILTYRNPAAHWGVSTSLSCPDDFPDPYDALTFILVPIRDVFTRRISLIAILKRLQFLGVLYNDMVDCGDNSRWQSLLEADLAFANTIRHLHPKKVAGLFTTEDHKIYRQLCVNDIIQGSARLQLINSKWWTLVGHVKACCLVYNDLIDQMSEIVEILFVYQNDFSFMAMLHGIRAANCYPERLIKYQGLTNIDGSYAVYRKESEHGHRLLFLPPYIHLWCCADNEVDKARLLYDSFRFVSYPGWQSFEQRVSEPIDHRPQHSPAVSRFSTTSESSPVVDLQWANKTLGGLDRLWRWVVKLLCSLLISFHLRGTSTTGSTHSDVEKCLPGAQGALALKSLSSQSDYRHPSPDQVERGLPKPSTG